MDGWKTIWLPFGAWRNLAGVNSLLVSGSVITVVHWNRFHEEFPLTFRVSMVGVTWIRHVVARVRSQNVSVPAFFTAMDGVYKVGPEPIVRNGVMVPLLK